MMSFPQMAFGGIRSRKLAIGSSNLIVDAITLTVSISSVKYGASDLVVSPVESSANGIFVSTVKSDLVTPSVVFDNPQSGTPPLTLSWATLTPEQWANLTPEQWSNLT